MPLIFIRQDITTLDVDAIVNSANPEASIGGGVDLAIHNAGGKELVKARIAIGTIRVAEAKVTLGYKLKAKHVIHVVGPRWRGGMKSEKRLLLNTYINALKEAKKLGCTSVAFPLISAGFFGFPKDIALKTAINAIQKFIDDNEMLVYLTILNDIKTMDSSELVEYLDNKYPLYKQTPFTGGKTKVFRATSSIPITANEQVNYMKRVSFSPKDQTWQEALLEWIKYKGLTNVEVYKQANLTKQHFSKILRDKDYHPSKPTALALCIALELDIDETKELLAKAGYTLALGYTFDVIVEHFIKRQHYNLFEINETLFEFGETLLGGFPK